MNACLAIKMTFYLNRADIFQNYRYYKYYESGIAKMKEIDDQPDMPASIFHKSDLLHMNFDLKPQQVSYLAILAFLFLWGVLMK